jgi:hypothetical protein
MKADPPQALLEVLGCFLVRWRRRLYREQLTRRLHVLAG